MSIKALQEYTRISKYAKYNKEKGRRETWNEQVKRVMDMHREYFKNKEEVLPYIEEAEKSILKKEVLGSQRALQFGGDPILKHNARIYNCFEKDTEFITNKGIKKFSDYKDGDNITVLTAKGNWKRAIVKHYGKQNLNEIIFRKGDTRCEFKVLATENHRWLLKDNIETTNLKVGDTLLTPPDLGNFDYDNADPFERLYWCYGYIFGGGTKIKCKYSNEYRYSMVRLCGNAINYAYRFEEMGFKSSSSLSLNGDIMCYTGKYQKTYPDVEKDSINLLNAFVDGFLSSDGHKNSNWTEENQSSKYLSIQQSDPYKQEFIESYFPLAGYYIISEKEITRESNFGKHDAKLYRIHQRTGKYGPKWKCKEIRNNILFDDVWCLEVEDDHSFVLPSGIPTGNCAASYCDRPRFFQEFLYTLLCGTGVGFSVQRHHVAKLPTIKPTLKEKKIFIIPDSIEGWADSIGELLNSYFNGSEEIIFDYSLIRPEGAPLSHGGKAPGPKGLENSHNKIRAILKEIKEERKLKPIECYDICMHISDAVLSGGIRRSACLTIFSPDDQEMTEAKTGSWFHDNPQRARSNNSALLLRDSTSIEHFSKLMKSVREYGEPGFIWADSKETLFNPCQPKWAKVLTPDGIRSFEDIKKNDIIWSKEGWTKIVKKWSTGVNKVYKYATTAGIFYGTSNHKVVSDGKKIEAGSAESIDIIKGVCPNQINHIPEVIMDGLVIGDGGVHKASNNLIVLYIDTKDIEDYQNSEISHLIKKHRPGVQDCAYEIYTSIVASELNSLPERNIPKRYINGNTNEVASFLKGLYSANGSICGDRVTLKATSKDIIEEVQMMLSSIGIRSYYTTNKSKTGNFKNGIYKREKSYDLNISSDKEIFLNLIGFIHKEKTNKLENLIKNQKRKGFEKRTYDIKEVTLVSEEETFDITVDNKSHTYWTQGCDVSNCVEVGLYGYDELENSGFQFCNLSEINIKKSKTEEKFYEQCRVASIIGTLQAAYTNFPYLGPITEKIVRREALLGVSMTGMMDNPDIAFNPKIQKKGAEIVLKTNEELANILGINPCARATCLKPSGTTSCILGTASGIHPHHATRYFRHVQENKFSEPLKQFEKYNPLAVEESVWSANNTDVVIKFLCEVPPGAKIKNQLNAISLLEHVKLTQQNWVKYGTRTNTLVKPYLSHNISNTINVKLEEWEEVEHFIYKNRKWFAGISLLPMSGDKDYAQAPFTAVYTPNEIVKEYGSGALFASGLIVDGMRCFNNDLWKACDTVLNKGEMSLEEYENRFKNEKDLNEIFLDQKDWIRRAFQFAYRYFDNDLKKMTYCLKDVRNWKIWCDLSREYKEVDWENFHENGDNTKISDTVACAGGSCDIL